MRTIILIVLWVLLGILYWLISLKCCDSVPAEATPISEEVVPVEEVSINKLSPFYFDCSMDELVTESYWTSFRDSLLNLSTPNQTLKVEGLYYANEQYSGQEKDLGLARAKSVATLFNEVYSDEIQVGSSLLEDSCANVEYNNLIRFDWVEKIKKVESSSNTATIRFPFGSSQSVNDPEITDYLNKVAQRVVASGEKIRITGHTDSEDSDAFNMALGERRAQSVADILIRKGVNPAKILIRSRGEREPIASNETEEGRKQNRRTELEIIK